MVRKLTEDQKTLKISNPLVECGHCRFTNALSGKWVVLGRRLVFVADADPLTTRGPDFESCCESDPVVYFEHITVDDVPLTAEQIADLRLGVMKEYS